ncbi:SRPBCC family protein [Planosporangium thailandense]|uniref:SRPBCC family protein n=1 Tax=Planosporangium thailandense TaxID=765197 RepID=A0ABX0XZC5_9ACTN|nr:SRPBCC family protein [Planosporangium thailandense]
MQLDNTFHVPVDVDRAWAVLTDLERIAPCMPGAALESASGDEYQGTVKIKVGPILVQYRGVARMREQDRTAGRFVVSAAGQDVRGQGNAEAVITVTLRPDGDLTLVRVATELGLTGKVAQLGQKAMVDISGRLIDQFVTRLRATVLDDKAEAPVAPAAAPEDEALDVLGLAGARLLLPPVVAAAATALFVWSLVRLARRRRARSFRAERDDHL